MEAAHKGGPDTAYLQVGSCGKHACHAAAALQKSPRADTVDIRSVSALAFPPCSHAAESKPILPTATKVHQCSIKEQRLGSSTPVQAHLLQRCLHGGVFLVQGVRGGKLAPFACPASLPEVPALALPSTTWLRVPPHTTAMHCKCNSSSSSLCPFFRTWLWQQQPKEKCRRQRPASSYMLTAFPTNLSAPPHTDEQTARPWPGPAYSCHHSRLQRQPPPASPQK